MMNGLALCARTVPQASLPERIELAARHGFSHVSMMGHDVIAILAGELPVAVVHDLLATHEIAIAELDAVVEWLPSAEPVPAEMRSPVGEAEFHVVADAFGATMMNVVDRADRPNGGVMLDTWHLFRGGGSVTDVAAVPAELIVGIQVNDAPEVKRNARVYQAVQHRPLPGDGVIGVAAILADLYARGCTAPIGCEVTSAELAARAADEVAALVAEAARRVSPSP